VVQHSNAVAVRNMLRSSRACVDVCRFCFFDKATQIDNGGGHETNLGFWKGFEKGGTVVRHDMYMCLDVLGLLSRLHTLMGT